MFEYEVAIVPAGDPGVLKQALNQLGAQGWMLVNTKEVALTPRGGLLAAGQPQAVPGLLCVFMRARGPGGSGPEDEPGPPDEPEAVTAGNRFREFQGGR